MGELSEMLKPGPTGNDKPPDGWRARLDLDNESGGYIVTKPYSPDAPPDHSEAIEEFGEDPELWQVVKVRRSRWQTYDERWLEAAQIHMVPRSAHVHDRADAERIIEQISKWRPRSTKKTTVEGAFVQPTGDLQLGKSDGGGSEHIVNLFLSETEAATQRLRSKLGSRKMIDTVCLAWLGDCVEGIWSQGGSLRMRLDLTPTEQVRAYRHLMKAQIKAFIPLAERIIVPVVPGNHDETIRVSGRMASTYDDSWAIEGASAVMDGINENPELRDRVEFRFPKHDELTITMDVAGTMIGMAHGHQFGSAKDGWRKWWIEQSGNRTEIIGRSDLLLAAHKHHLRIQDHGDGRVFIQIPALDGGSTWFRHRHGEAAPSRMVSFWTMDGHAWGLDPVTVRPPEDES